MLVAGQDALDQYFMREPDRLLGRSVEEAIIDLHNPHISGPHLEAAAYERPLTADDEAFFGEQGLLQAERLAQGGRLRRRKDGLVWSRPYSPAAGVGLRTASNEQFAIVEARQGEVIGTVERERVFRFCHPGAVYLHLGRSYIVQHLDLEARTVMIDDFDGSYYTQAKTDKNVLIAGQADSRELPGAALFAGDLEVTEQVIAYQRRDMTDGHVLDTTTLDLPEQDFSTQAFWLAVPAARARRRPGRPRRDRRAGGSRLPARRRARADRPASRCTPCATAGTSAGSAPPGTGRPTRRASSCTTATPAASVCRAGATTPLRAWRRRRGRSSPSVPARAAVPAACRAPSAATSTSR